MGHALTCGRMAAHTPGLTVRRPTGQPTNVTFTNNLGRERRRDDGA